MRRLPISPSAKRGDGVPPGAHSTARRRRKSRPRQPCLILKRFDHGREVVEACCRRCAVAGVLPGMTIAHARALVATPELIVEPHDPAADARALEALARWSLRIAPIVALDPPDGLLMDLSGCHTIYRDESILLRRIARSFARLGLTTRIAMAGSFACAAAMARGGPDPLMLVAPGGEREAIGSLPVSALRLGNAMTFGLDEIGIQRVGELLNLRRADLVMRFGLELSIALDRAMGIGVEVVEPVRATEPMRVEQCFNGPVLDLETILLASRHLIDQLTSLLEKRESGVRRLDILLERIETDPLRLSVRLSRPNRRSAHLWSLLRPRLESVNLGFGIERIELRAALTGRLRHDQLRYEGMAAMGETRTDEPTSPDPSWVMSESGAELVDTLAERLGPGNVLSLHPLESHVPERSVRLASATEPVKRLRTERLDRDRPSLLLAHPEPVDVMAMTPDGPPYWMRLHGREHHLQDASGPERINHEWWRDQGERAAHRDYFRVQTETGRWLWLFRAASTGRWYVHGVWA